MEKQISALNFIQDFTSCRLWTYLSQLRVLADVDSQLQACKGSSCLPNNDLYTGICTGLKAAEGCSQQPPVGQNDSLHWHLICSLLGQKPPSLAPLLPLPSWNLPLLQPPGPLLHLCCWIWQADCPQGIPDLWTLQGHSCDSCLFLGARYSPLFPVALCHLHWSGCCLRFG